MITTTLPTGYVLTVSESASFGEIFISLTLLAAAVALALYFLKHR